jgi:hypothetical protein
MGHSRVLNYAHRKRRKAGLRRQSKPGVIPALQLGKFVGPGSATARNLGDSAV